MRALNLSPPAQTHPSSLHPSLLSSTEGRLHLIQSLPQSTTATPLPMLSTFGELRSFQPLSSQGGQREFVAEYWDDHAAEKARGWLDGRFVGVREGGEGGEGWWEVKAERRSSHEVRSFMICSHRTPGGYIYSRHSITDCIREAFRNLFTAVRPSPRSHDEGDELPTAGVDGEHACSTVGGRCRLSPIISHDSATSCWRID